MGFMGARKSSDTKAKEARARDQQTTHTMSSETVSALVNGVMSPHPGSPTALKILSKLLTNVTENPQEEKYRTVKTTNKAIQSKLLSVDGARDVLIALGFVDLGDMLVLIDPSEDDLATVQEGLAVILSSIPTVPLEEKTSSTSSTSSASSFSSPVSSSSSSPAPRETASKGSGRKPSEAEVRHREEVAAVRRAKEKERADIKASLARDKAERANRGPFHSPKGLPPVVLARRACVQYCTHIYCVCVCVYMCVWATRALMLCESPNVHSCALLQVLALLPLLHTHISYGISSNNHILSRPRSGQGQCCHEEKLRRNNCEGKL